MFDSAKQKVDRADYHLTDLKWRFANFVNEKPHRFSIKSDAKSGGLNIEIRFIKQLPSDFSPIISDAIHNLRTALDHTAWELVGIDKGTQDRSLQFPNSNNRGDFEINCDGIKTPSQWVKDAFKYAEVFPGGKGSDLYQLCQLDNADKHKEITPVLQATRHPPYRIVAADGTIVRTVESNEFPPVASGTTIVRVADIPAGHSVELDDVAVCLPGIFFSHPDGYTTSSAIETLERYIVRLVETIEEMETKASSAKCP